MSEKVSVYSVQPEEDGPIFARAIDPLDTTALQTFAHSHTEQIVRDLLMASAPGALVAGFGATATGTLHVTLAHGTVVGVNGLSYDSGDDPFVVNLNPAHATQPRIDLIYATLEADAETDSSLVDTRRLRTTEELEAVPPVTYPTVEIDLPTRLLTRATIAVHTGTPNASPTAPAVGGGEVALWQVHVAATQTVLAGGDLTSVRALMTSLYTMATYKPLLDAATRNDTVSTLVKRDGSGDTRVNKLEVDAGVVFEGDSSYKFRAFPRESVRSLLDQDVALSFHGAVLATYETVKRTAVNSSTNAISVPVVAVAEELDCFIDPADFVNVNCKLEVLGMHTSDGGGDAVWDTDVQLYNVTDAAQLAVLNFTWLETAGRKRSSVFSITGTGCKRLVLRARQNTSLNHASMKLWRVRLVINPSF